MTDPSSHFSSLPIRAEIISAVSAAGYSAMTPVQIECLPSILSGKDIVAQAETGSGKTAAFAIGILNQLELQKASTQALVLCPTRELADQVAGVIRQLSAKMANTRVVTLCGGKPMQGQLASLQRSPHIVVGTPGRVLKHFRKESIGIEDIHTLVLDEGDRMLDMGFSQEINDILGFLPQRKQTLLFSATFPEEILQISQQIQNHPEVIRVTDSAENSIEQCLYEVKDNKPQLLIDLLQQHQPESCIIFCNQKNDCRELARTLSNNGFYARELHGDLEQHQRDQAIVQFDHRSCTILVATDLASRGLDIKELAAVINYDVTPDPEVHVHRIGRTGRAGKSGLAITLYHASEAHRVNAIEDYQNTRIDKKTISERGNRPSTITPPMITLQIRGGRKDKVRPGDIVGALTATKQLTGEQIGKITVTDKTSYVSVMREASRLALRILADGKIKGRKFRVSSLT